MFHDKKVGATRGRPNNETARNPKDDQKKKAAKKKKTGHVSPCAGSGAPPLDVREGSLPMEALSIPSQLAAMSIVAHSCRQALCAAPGRSCEPRRRQRLGCVVLAVPVCLCLLLLCTAAGAAGALSDSNKLESSDDLAALIVRVAPASASVAARRNVESGPRTVTASNGDVVGYSAAGSASSDSSADSSSEEAFFDSTSDLCGVPGYEVCTSVRAAAVTVEALTSNVSISRGVPHENATVQVLLAAGWYGADSCNARFSRSVDIIGAGSSVTVIDCEWTSRFVHLNGTDSAVASRFSLAGVALVNCSSYLNGAEVDGVADGGAVLVSWPNGGSDLVARFEDVVVTSSLAVYNGSVDGVPTESTSGHVIALGVIGGAIGVALNSSADHVTVTVHNCSFTNTAAIAGMVLRRGRRCRKERRGEESEARF